MQRVYQAIEHKLPKGIYAKVYYQTIKDDTKDCVGIFLYESSNTVETLDGSTVYECVKAHIQVNAEPTEDGIFKALNYLRQFVYNIENERSDVDGVSFIMCQHLGAKAISIGKNAFNIPVCVSNVDIKYILKQ